MTLDDVMSFIKTISGGISGILVIVGFLAAMSKTVREKVSKWIRSVAGVEAIEKTNCERE